jgi:multiple sugar transport system permease protein
MAITERQNITLMEPEAVASIAPRKGEGEGQQLSSGQKIATHVVLIILSLIFLVPFFWMVTGSLKTDAQMSAFPITWFPNPATLGNYIYGLQAEPFGLYIINSLIICFFSIIGALFSSSFVAYGLARIDWPLRTPLFVVILSTTMIPFYVTMVPLFTLFRTMGWINTYLPLILPTFFGVPFFIFLLYDHP